MKKLLTFLILFLMLSSYVQSQNPYEIKSARIDFVFINGFQSGIKTLIFTDSGKTEKTFTVTHMDTSLLKDMPKEFPVNIPPSEILFIQTQDSVFTVDLQKLIGNRRHRFNLDMSTVFHNQGKTIGTDTFLNRKCEIIDFQGFKIWYWKGIALKKEMTIDGNHKTYEYATSIDEAYLIKTDEFKMPDNIKLQ